MKIGVLTDSSAYLTPEEQQADGIKVLPIPIIWGKQTYYDLVTIGFHEFYQKLASDSDLPNTSQPSTGELKEAIDKFVADGYTDVFVITLSSGISGFYNNVVQYAQQEDRLKIHPFDSKVTCAGLAFQAQLAGRLAKTGADAETIQAALEDLRSTTRVRFEVDNLQHLKRTGRLSNAASFIGGLLKIKPILTMNVQTDGKIVAIAKERQERRALRHIITDVQTDIAKANYPVQGTIFHADDEAKEDAWCKAFQTEVPTMRLGRSIIGPVVGTHVGQHTMSIIWAKDLAEYFK
ncbi:MAG: DegV family protein [Lactobacillus sp.]|jgi:DegV family protein with EDD domain|nr:DegV family protein [Lactobacillus sp.]MCH3906291.1 DegV family protein [Lactobacillus sp.]MCH3990134.1 DegV family protein [Lactobacillus sp.]MCH4069152.1 DegV family protein [Lactobacillus sp.]MCI1303861.1 DegV family protein [Lactobacillus sp.]